VLSEVWLHPDVRAIEASVNAAIAEFFPTFDTGRSFYDVHPNRRPRAAGHKRPSTRRLGGSTRRPRAGRESPAGVASDSDSSGSGASSTEGEVPERRRLQSPAPLLPLPLPEPPAAVRRGLLFPYEGRLRRVHI
jgi:hypothetical protein